MSSVRVQPKKPPVKVVLTRDKELSISYLTAWGPEIQGCESLCRDVSRSHVNDYDWFGTDHDELDDDLDDLEKINDSRV